MDENWDWYAEYAQSWLREHFGVSYIPQGALSSCGACPFAVATRRGVTYNLEEGLVFVGQTIYEDKTLATFLRRFDSSMYPQLIKDS
jgi:hypothetical protein